MKKPEVETELDDAAAEPVNEKPSTFYWLVIGLHLLIVALNGVPIFIYFQRLWNQEHYQFFPIAMLVFIYILFVRIQYGEIRESISGVIFCVVILIMSAALFLISSFTDSVLLPTVGAWLVIASLLVCFQDKETNRSLFPIWLLLVPMIRIPLNFDILLITQLQFFSSNFASNILDILYIPNYTPGTVIQVAAQLDYESGIKRFDVERACSGIQSLFTLFFCTLTVAVWSRRSFVAGLALVLSGIFWSVTMNAIRIVICVSFYHWFDFDVYSGVKHEILGYLVLFGAIGLIASTDAIFGFLFGPIDTSGTKNYYSRLWNRFVAGVISRKTHSQKNVRSQNVRIHFRRIIFITLGLCIAAAAYSMIFHHGAASYSSRLHVGDLFLNENDLQIETVESIEQQILPLKNSSPKFQNLRRNTNSIFGRFSSTWRFESLGNEANRLVSLDYPFDGWHELKVCYLGSGWNVSRQIYPQPSWDSVELIMEDRLGEFGYCIFSQFDIDGVPVQVVADRKGTMFEQVLFRLSRFSNRKTTFQVQCFVQSSDPFTEKELDEIRQLHKTTRELLRTKVLEKLKNRDE